MDTGSDPSKNQGSSTAYVPMSEENDLRVDEMTFDRIPVLVEEGGDVEPGWLLFEQDGDTLNVTVQPVIKVTMENFVYHVPVRDIDVPRIQQGWVMTMNSRLRPPMEYARPSDEQEMSDWGWKLATALVHNYGRVLGTQTTDRTMGSISMDTSKPNPDKKEGALIHKTILNFAKLTDGTIVPSGSTSTIPLREETPMLEVLRGFPTSLAADLSPWNITGREVTEEELSKLGCVNLGKNCIAIYSTIGVEDLLHGGFIKSELDEESCRHLAGAIKQLVPTVKTGKSLQAILNEAVVLLKTTYLHSLVPVLPSQLFKADNHSFIFDLGKNYKFGSES